MDGPTVETPDGRDSGDWSPERWRSEQPAPDTPGPLWLRALPGLGLLAAVLTVWWPSGARWRSDDLLATHYASDLGRTLSDFGGAQYGATDIWLFYRPLITFAFWLERTVFEGSFASPTATGISDEAGLAFLAMLINVLAHGITAALLWRLWTRFTDGRRAWCIALAWAVLPTHIEALWWGVGRVDSHTHVWIALSLLCFVRWLEHRARTRWSAIFAALAALCSKEQAIVIAPFAVLLAMFLPGSEAAGSMGTRIRKVLGRTWPILLVTALWFLGRAAVLGVAVGGYTANTFDLGQGLGGLGFGLLRILNPLTWIGQQAQTNLTGGAWPGWAITLGFAPALLGAVLWCRRKTGLKAAPGFLLAILVAMAPVYAFWSEPSHNNLRYYYTATMLLAALPAAGGFYTLVPVLLLWATPLLDLQAGVRGAWEKAGDAHDRLRDAAVSLAEDGRNNGPLFATELPRAVPLMELRPGGPNEFVRCLHYGVDRMLQPPFLPEGAARALLPLRTMRGGRAQWMLPEDPPAALPGGTTVMLEPMEGWAVAPGARGTAPLPVQPVGFTDLRTPSLSVLANPDSEAALVTPGVRCPWYRLTLFTGVGYVTAVVQNSGTEGDPDGRIRLWDWIALGSDRRPTPPGDPKELRARVITQLMEPTVADLDTTFPVLLEGGDLDPELKVFHPTHRTPELLPLAMDRGYGRAVRQALGLE